jgi:hypothetical protein
MAPRTWWLIALGLGLLLGAWALLRRQRGDRASQVPVGWHSEAARAIRGGTAAPPAGGPTPGWESLRLDELFAVEDVRAFGEALRDHVLAKRWRSAPGTLTAVEALLGDVMDLEMEVNNGGFEQYFFNSAGDRAHAVVASLEAIGARATADLARRALSVFDRSAPSADREERWRQMDAWSRADLDLLRALDTKFLDSREDLGALMTAYARTRRAELSEVVEAR